MDYVLIIEGRREFFEVKILRVNLYFRCNNKECSLVKTVPLKASDLKKNIEKSFTCDCKSEFRMINNDTMFRRTCFTVYGDFCLSKTVLSDDDVLYRGKVFGKKFNVTTTNEGSWKMDDREFFKIATANPRFSKRNFAVGFELEKLSIGEVDEVEEEALIGVPETEGLRVCVQPLVPTDGYVPATAEPATTEGSPNTSSGSSEDTVEVEEKPVEVSYDFFCL